MVIRRSSNVREADQEASPDGYGTARIVATASSPNGVRDQSPQVPKSPDPAGELDEVRNLVIGALGLKSENVPTELSADTCPDWDSLGQIAIASAIFDRYGVALDEGTLYRLRTLGDVAYAAAGGPFGTTVDVQTPHETFSETEPVEPVAVSAVGSLPEDFEMLPLLDPQEATRLLAERFQDATESDDLTPIRVVVAATFTAQPVATSLRLWGRASGFDIDCHFADYNQIVRTLLDDSSPFCANRDGVNVILARPEDVVADSEENTSSYVDQIFQAATHFECSGPKSGQLLIGTLPPVVSSFSTLDREIVEKTRHDWRARIDSTPGVQSFDFGRVVEQIGINEVRSNVGEALHRAPYSPRLYQSLGIALIRQIRARRTVPRQR